MRPAFEQFDKSWQGRKKQRRLEEIFGAKWGVDLLGPAFCLRQQHIKKFEVLKSQLLYRLEEKDQLLGKTVTFCSKLLWDGQWLICCYLRVKLLVTISNQIMLTVFEELTVSAI